ALTLRSRTREERLIERHIDVETLAPLVRRALRRERPHALLAREHRRAHRQVLAGATAEHADAAAHPARRDGRGLEERLDLILRQRDLRAPAAILEREQRLVALRLDGADDRREQILPRR